MTSPVFARFRADPRRVSVSLFRNGRGDYVATVREKTSLSPVVFGQASTPQQAIFAALHEAESLGMRGIDLGMKRTYPHPWPEAAGCEGDARITCLSATLPSAGVAT